MEGFTHNEVVRAHHNSVAALDPVDERILTASSRDAREEQLERTLALGATREHGAGNRGIDEEPDLYRTCFERDRDRILHSTSFRRLSGKTQVFVFPEDHMRTRLTHALEVAQVATSVARALGLNTALTEAIALGHDCGHGPGGHASEEALAPYVEGGFDHATWGADVSLRSLNLCRETLDGIRNHSWSRPAPATPEGEVVSWADRIAYVCHDFEDAASAGLVSFDDLPEVVRDRCGSSRRRQLGSFINSMIATTRATGVIGMDSPHAEALAAFRAYNYASIYMRDASQLQAQRVVGMLRALVEHYAAHPELLAGAESPSDIAESPTALSTAVSYVAGMTDRYACRSAVTHLSWPIDQLPNGIDR
ncbi:MAG: HD domain-containing protein [Acidimicrobiaceae bacterium]|nr:HD domain-containing protein [Acidimicrobiaceae bacterium]